MLVANSSSHTHDNTITVTAMVKAVTHVAMVAETTMVTMAIAAALAVTATVEITICVNTKNKDQCLLYATGLR